MVKNRKSQFKASKILLEIVTYSWLCAEIGQFVQLHISWGQNALFWPFWICLSSTVALGAKLLDGYGSNLHGE